MLTFYDLALPCIFDDWRTVKTWKTLQPGTIKDAEVYLQALEARGFTVKHQRDQVRSHIQKSFEEPQEAIDLVLILPSEKFRETMSEYMADFAGEYSRGVELGFKKIFKNMEIFKWPKLGFCPRWVGPELCLQHGEGLTEKAYIFLTEPYWPGFTIDRTVEGVQELGSKDVWMAHFLRRFPWVLTRARS